MNLWKRLADAVRRWLEVHYFSTACAHGEHAYCRRSCKYCGAPCRCACHDTTTPLLIASSGATP